MEKPAPKILRQDDGPKLTDENRPNVYECE